MWGSAVFCFGAIVAVLGFALTARPLWRLRVSTRVRGLMIASAGSVVAAMGLLLPASESRAGEMKTRAR